MTGSAPALLEHEVTPRVEQFLGIRGLELAPTTTHLTSIEDGCDFLGQHVRTYTGKLLIKPAQQKVKTFLGTSRHIVQVNTQATAGNLLAQRNPVIRGWANDHRHVVRTATCITVDTAICKSLGAWARRRPPKQTSRWVAKKYVHPRHGRQWTFVGTRAGTQGQPAALALLRAGDVPIQRHVQITGAANPYDPQWAVDCEERLGVKMTQTLKGRRPLLYLGKHHNGLCPGCHQKITRRTGWHNHPGVWRTHGGKDTSDNRVLLHPNCHRQVHSQRLDGAPSRSAKSV